MKICFLVYCDFIKAFSSSETQSSDAYAPSISDNNLIALQDLDTNDFENCNFAKKFTSKTDENMEKLMACVGHSMITLYL